MGNNNVLSSVILKIESVVRVDNYVTIFAVPCMKNSYIPFLNTGENILLNLLKKDRRLVQGASFITPILVLAASRWLTS